MATKRMFSKKITDTDAFLDMPATAQLLYFHLNMNADDEGFVGNPRKIIRSIGSSNDDFKILLAKRYILTFDSGVIVVKHWKIHNIIRADRIVATTYQDEKSTLAENEYGAYTERRTAVKEIIEKSKIKMSTSAKKRNDIYKKSELPYSFSQKIRQSFDQEICPICGKIMVFMVGTKRNSPTIQHCNPISAGGLHEIGNVAVICYECNCSINNNGTGLLNNGMVIDKWEKIIGCQSADSQPHRLDKDRLDKNSIGKDSISDKKAVATTPQAEFIEDLKAAYEKKTSMKMKVNRKDYPIIAKLINEFSIDDVRKKAKVMAIYCEKGNLGWWCKGWGDFTIGNLSCRWNELVPKLTEEEKAIKEVVEHEERCRELGLRNDKQIT